MSSPRLSVSAVISCYNYGAYLPACIESVLAQTHPAQEIIVVDDGSTDDTVAAVTPYLRDSRVRFHQQANLGQAASKNVGARLAQGDIVAYLDADDWWLPKKLETQLPLFDNPAVGVTFTDHSTVDASGMAVGTFVRRGYFQFRRGRVTRWLGFENFVPFSSSAIRRSLLLACGGFDETLTMGIDWDLWLRLSLETQFDFVPDALFAYRLHATQMSRNLVGRIDASERIFRTFVERYPAAFTDSQLHAVAYYNACSRGQTLAAIDRSRSNKCFLEAVRMKPWSPRPYVGLLQNALSRRG